MNKDDKFNKSDLLFTLTTSLNVLSVNIYLFLENLDLFLLVVELVTLLPHGSQQLCDAPLLGVDHLLIKRAKRKLHEVFILFIYF